MSDSKNVRYLNQEFHRLRKFEQDYIDNLTRSLLLIQKSENVTIQNKGEKSYITLYQKGIVGNYQSALED